MSSLSMQSIAKLEEVFEMRNGYVVNYTNASFRSLILRITHIDVYSGEYDDNVRYPSKAKKLRRFIEIESDEMFGNCFL